MFGDLHRKYEGGASIFLRGGSINPTLRCILFFICILSVLLSYFSSYVSLSLLFLMNSPLWFIRVEYKQLDRLRDILLDVPFVGLTATATAKLVSNYLYKLILSFPCYNYHCLWGIWHC